MFFCIGKHLALGILLNTMENNKFKEYNLSPYLIFGIFLYLIKNRKVTAKELAKEFEISQRSIYRYIDALSLCGMPIITKLGKGGGIELIGEPTLDGIILSTSEKNILKRFLEKQDNFNELEKVLKKLI